VYAPTAMKARGEVELARVPGDRVQPQRDGHDEGLRRHRDQVVVLREEWKRDRYDGEQRPARPALKPVHQRAPLGEEALRPEGQVTTSSTRAMMSL
jgi:hypothetical protein